MTEHVPPEGAENAMSDPSKAPMICQSCGWRGIAGELMIRDGDLRCPQCDSNEIAQVLGAPVHQDPDK